MGDRGTRDRGGKRIWNRAEEVDFFFLIGVGEFQEVEEI